MSGQDKSVGFNEIRIQIALAIMAVWHDGAERSIREGTNIGKLYALRWKTIGIINHDRVINVRKNLADRSTFEGRPGIR